MPVRRTAIEMKARTAYKNFVSTMSYADLFPTFAKVFSNHLIQVRVLVYPQSIPETLARRRDYNLDGHHTCTLSRLVVI